MKFVLLSHAVVSRIKRRFKTVVECLRRRLRRVSRRLSGEKASKGYNFCILCINSTDYADMSIENINSLHYFNNSHNVTIYADALCADFLRSKFGLIDYPSRVSILEFWDSFDGPWQRAKIEVFLLNKGHRDVVVLDADVIWTSPPFFDLKKISFAFSEGPLKAQNRNFELLCMVFPFRDFGKVTHYNTSIISIPLKFHVDEFEILWLELYDQIRLGSNSRLGTEQLEPSFLRISEQLACSISVADLFCSEIVSVQKDGEGPVFRTSFAGARGWVTFVHNEGHRKLPSI